MIFKPKSPVSRGFVHGLFRYILIQMWLFNVVLAEQTEQHLQNIVLIHHLAVILVCFGQLGQQISAH